MGGKFDLSDVKLTREGEVDSPLDTSSIADWNNTINKFAEHIKENQLQSKLKKLSDTYRISNFCIEGERGFLSKGGQTQMNNIVNYLNNNFKIIEE